MPNEAVDIAESARHLAPEERESFLTSTCADNDALLKEVRALLASDQTMDVGSGKTLIDSTSRHKNRVPEWIGQFHVRREIGVGGMGAVYEALQENPRRRVAIKVLKSSVVSEAARKRFEYESQVLGRLKHPGIAEIYEAGTYDDGSGPMPYFAMEYIAGRKQIDTYSQEKELDRDARLRLFTQVCEALHHGHQKGIIHRDLKPGNILVDTEGRPRVIDFGVARATDSDVALATMQTEVGQIIGTIEYMSPEQCEGEPDLIDLRSDVYSLGVILFELLTGERPRKLDSSSIYEAIKTIRESAPTRMGTLDRSLRGDLETIVGKAMEKDPDRRYQSAFELKQDIDRFLASEPIEARPPSIAYQTKMFAKRHKAVAASIIIVAIVLVATTSWSLVERGRAARAATQAQLDRDVAINAEVAMAAALEKATIETARTERAKTFMTGVFKLADPANAQGRRLTVPQMIQEASEQIPGVFADEPAMAAQLHATLGGIQLEFGDVDLAERNLMKALVLAERAHGTSSLEALSAGTLVAATMVEQGRYDEAKSRLDTILEATALKGEDGRKIDLLARKWALQIMGSQLHMAEVATLSKALVEDSRAIYGPDHVRTLGHEVTYGQYLLTTLRLSGQPIPEEIERPYGSLERVESIVGALHPITLRVRLSEAMLAMGALGGSGESGAEGGSPRELLDALVKDMRLVLGDTHARTLEAIYIQGIIWLSSGEMDAAVNVLTESYDGFVANHGENHPMAHQVATMLGAALLNLERLEEAAPVLKASWRGQKKLWGEEDIRTVTAESNYAIALLLLGRFEEGNPIFESALQHHDLFPEAMLAASRFKMLFVKMSSLLEFDRLDEAVVAAEKVLEVAKSSEETDAKTRWAYPVEALFLFLANGHVEEAALLSDEVMAFTGEMLADDPNRHVQVLLTVGHKFLRAGGANAGADVVEETLDFLDDEEVDDANKGRSLIMVGIARARTGRPEEAIPLIEEGLSRVSNSVNKLAARRALAEAMAGAGRIAEARDLALAILPALVGIGSSMDHETEWTVRWLLSEAAGLAEAELAEVALSATSGADAEFAIGMVREVMNAVPSARLEVVLPALDEALERVHAALEEPSPDYTRVWFDVNGWKAHFLDEAGDAEAARETAGRLAAQQWAVLGDDDVLERDVFVAAADRLLELLENVLGPEDHRVLANRGRLAMARGEKHSAAAFLEAARDASDDPEQKAFYLDIIISLRE